MCTGVLNYVILRPATAAVMWITLVSNPEVYEEGELHMDIRPTVHFPVFCSDHVPADAMDVTASPLQHRHRVQERFNGEMFGRIAL